MSEIKLNTIEEAIEDFREGKFLIVVDDEDRENEGDFIIAAEKKRKSATRQRCSHSQLPGRIERMNLFYFIQTFVDLLSR